jgi:hypothetical protein
VPLYVEPGSLPLERMSASKTVLRPLAVLKLPENKVPLLVTYARSIVHAMTGNPSFPSPRPSLATVAAAVEVLSEAEAATRSRTAGTVTARDEKRLALVGLLQQLLSYVQATADAGAENGPAIIESAGMAVKKTRVHPPGVFAAKRGPVSGSVKLVAPKAGNRAGYEWAYSTDGGKTWVSLPFTVQASTTLFDLQPASTVHFRYRAVTKDGTGDWGQTLSMLVE